MRSRIITSVLLLLAAFFFPWWFVCICMLVGIWVFPSYGEALVVGIVLDSLYNAPVPLHYGFQFTITLVTLICICMAEYAKQRLAFYR